MSMTWSIVKKQQDLVAEPAEVGFKLSAGSLCLAAAAIADWIDAFSGPKGTWRF